MVNKKIRKYVIRKKSCKDYFGGFGMLISTDKLRPLWYDRNSEDVFKFFSKSEAKFWIVKLIKEGYNVKIVKLKKNEQVREECDN